MKGNLKKFACNIALGTIRAAIAGFLAFLLIALIITCSYPIFGLGCMAINEIFDTDLQNPVELLAQKLGLPTGNSGDAIGYHGPRVVRPGFIY